MNTRGSITPDGTLALRGNYAEFEAQVNQVLQTVLREVFQHYQNVIRIKKERVGLEKLEGIFQHTLAISNRKGFQAMSVRDLSEATGLSMGSLYSYIESKETLLDMVLHHGQVAARRMLAVPGQLTGARARLAWLLRTHIYLTEAMRPWFYFAYMESKHFSKRARDQAIESERSTEVMIVNLLREGVDSGEFDVDDLTLTASLVKPLLQDWYLKRWKYRRRQVELDTYADAVIAMVEARVLR